MVAKIQIYSNFKQKWVTGDKRSLPHVSKMPIFKLQLSKMFFGQTTSG